MSEQQNPPRSNFFALIIHIRGFLITRDAAAWLFPSKTDGGKSSQQSHQPARRMSGGQIHPRPLEMAVALAALLDPALS